ncbi:MAG: ABC transporter ATP-binding protein [Bryobacterales bacterium]|nr:ABC transporter ATP-binding protein [Bryobacterales bacterium]
MTTSPLQQVRSWLVEERTLLWIAVIYSVAIGLLSLVVPVAVQSLVNTVAFGNLLQPLFVLTLVVLAGLGFSGVLQGLRTFVVELLQRRIFVRVSSDVVGKLLRAKVEAFDGHHGPELVNRFLEVVTVQKSGAILLIDGLSILMQTSIGMILLAVYHPWLLAFDVLLFLAILVVLFPMGRGAVGTSILESKAKYELVAWLEEIARWPASFKPANGYAFATERTDALVKKYLGYRVKHFRILIRQILGSLGLHALASAVLLGAGGWLVIQRQLTLGQLVAAELVVTLVVSGFSKFGKQLETFYDLCAAADKLSYLTELPTEESGKDRLPDKQEGSRVLFRDVRFAYPNSAPIIQNGSCEIPAGGRVALTGHGKTTFLDLLYGLRTPAGGEIEIDSLDSRDIQLTSLRAQIGLVRRPEIFQGTIADNLRVANPAAGAVEMRSALDQAGLLDEIRNLPDGLDTQLVTGGLPLSHSQALRLMIAREVLKHPRLLLLDECLDEIEDIKLRSRIMAGLFDASKPWTVLVSTKNPEVRAACEQHFHLEEGTLREYSKR